MESINVKFFPLKNGESSQGELMIEVTHSGDVILLETDFELYAHEWDSENHRVLFNSGDIGRAMYLYNKWENVVSNVARLELLMNKMKYQSRNFTLSDIKAKFIGISGKKFFIQFLDELIVAMKKDFKTKTIQSYISARHIFASFLGEKDIEFRYIDSELINDFEAFLLSKGLVRNTTSFYMRILRSVYNKGVNREYVKQVFPFRNVYTGIDKTVKRAVDGKIIEKMKNLDKLSRNYSFCRDIFLFSFYARGLSFVDLAALKKRDIKNGVLHYRRSKTGQSLSVRIEPCMKEIIERYQDCGQAEGYLFPLVFNENNFHKEYSNALRIHNIRLKKLGKMLGIQHPLTSYVARHTWATIARKKGVSMSIISECMGHTSEGTTRIYLASFDQNVLDKANRLILYDKKSSKNKLNSLS